MVSVVVGVLLIAFTVISVLPGCLGWGPEVVGFLKGCAPVLAAFIGLIALFIGAADIKDKKEARKEEEAAQAQEKKE